MLRSTSIQNKNITIGIIMAFAIIVQSLFLRLPSNEFTVFITTGIAAGFIASFSFKVLPGIIVSSVLTRYFVYLVLLDFSFFYSTGYVLSLLFLDLITSVVLLTLMNRFDSKAPDNFRQSVLFILIVFVTSFIASLLPAFQVFMSRDISLISAILIYLKPTIMGLATITSPIILSNLYDDHLGESYSHSLLYIVYGIFYLVLSFFVFSDSLQLLHLGLIGPIFVTCFIPVAFIFNFRMLIYFTLTYIIFYSIKLSGVEIDLQSSMLFAFNFNLLSISVITVVTKLLIRNVKLKNISLGNTNVRLEEMMSSTMGLLKIQDYLNYNNETYKEDYVQNIFDIACKIFNQFDSAICVLTDGNDLRIIDTLNYDIDFVRSWKLKSGSINWDHTGPAHTKEPLKYYKRVIGSKFDSIKTRFPLLKESMRIIIQVGDNQYGGITFDINQKSKSVFTRSDQENIRAFQNLVNSFHHLNELSIKNSSLKDDIVLSLIRTLELYDHYTGGHSEHVAKIAQQIALEMKLSDEQVYDVYWSGIVHDIGKIGIDFQIINKPSKLTLEEYEQVKQHPVHGYNILSRSEDLNIIAKYVKHHHEWWNGSGYPDGLSEEQIPFASQILGVADSISSMSTKRIYTKVKSNEDIILELEMYKGTQFSPKVADVAIKLIKNGLIDDL